MIDADKFFDRADAFLDEAFTVAQNALDDAFLKAEAFLSEWRENAANLTGGKENEPTVEQMLNDIATQNESKMSGGRKSAWRDDSPSIYESPDMLASLKRRWEQVPSEFRTAAR